MNITKHIQVIRVPWAWPLLGWGDAGYWGRRWYLIMGPLVIIIWQLSEAQQAAWHKQWFGEPAE